MEATPTAILQEIFLTGRVQAPNGTYLDVTANISQDNSVALENFVLRNRPQLAVEIGMAYGVSTLSILAGLHQNKKGKLISIDPYINWPTGRLVALNQIEKSGVSSLHDHIHECSYSALPKLLHQGIQPDLIYIDGNHNFDYVFTDFFFADKILAPGGVVAFNDAGWRSVHKVIRFMARYRKYHEIDVGLPRKYRARNPLYSLIKRIEGRSSNDRYFVKSESWEPDHGFQGVF